MSDDTKVISIEDLRKEFLAKQQPKDLKEFAHKQQEILEWHIREVKKLKEKLSQLEMATSSMSLLKNNMDDEEIICVKQIQILKEKSATRELDINEVKKLDLLIKNLRLIRSQSTETPDVPYRDVSEGDLLAIASGKTTEDTK